MRMSRSMETWMASWVLRTLADVSTLITLSVRVMVLKCWPMAVVSAGLRLLAHTSSLDSILTVISALARLSPMRCNRRPVRSRSMS